jgi:hypothetical protein
VAAAAASGLGVLGFVTFAGGVVLWRRFSGMGLPAGDAVALVPKAVLVATGAEFLLPALGMAALTVLALVIIRIMAAPDEAVRTRQRAVSLYWSRLVGVAVALLQTGVALFALSEIGAFAFVLLVCIAALGGLVVGLSFRYLGSVAAVALIAFLIVGTFWVVRAYEKTLHAPTVIPMAYSRAQQGKPPRVETGYLVAETSDRIWFASLPRPDARNPVNELREFPRSETDDLEIGQLIGTDHAEAPARAALFASNLCARLTSLALAVAAKERRTAKKSAAGTNAIPTGCASH